MSARKKKKNKAVKKILAAVIFVAIILIATLLVYLFGGADAIRAWLGIEPEEEPRVPTAVDGTMNLHFIDIGQGDCMLLESDGNYMLIDTGDISDTYTAKIIDYLEERGIETIEYLILTHPDADHIGGAPDIINTFKVNHCIMPDFTKTTKIFEKTIDALEENEVDVIEAEPDYEFKVGEAECEILAPLKKYDDPNEASVVLKVYFGSNSFLLTGDAEKESEADMTEYYSASQLKADVLKSGHHGSRTSSSEGFLEAVAPELIVISCGEGNSYGHPHKETIDRYEQMEITYYRTDIVGTVVITSDGEELKVTTEKGE